MQIYILFTTPRLPLANEVWAKVIFAEACVSHSVILFPGARGSLYDVTSRLAAWSHFPSGGGRGSGPGPVLHLGSHSCCVCFNVIFQRFASSRRLRHLIVELLSAGQVVTREVTLVIAFPQILRR